MAISITRQQQKGERMSNLTTKTPVWKTGFPSASDIGISNEKPFVIIDFRVPLQDGSHESYRKFLPVTGKGLEMTKRVLSTLGFKGKLSSLTNKGLHNGSTELSFGETFEIEIQEINERLTIGDIRKPGQARMKSALSLSEAEQLLGDISVDAEGA
jgi:hypothetical protein